VRGASVWIGWGDAALDASRDAVAHPERSAGRVLKAAWGAEVPQRAGGFWPGRWERVAPSGSFLAAALRDAPPLIWLGQTGTSTLTDEVRWSGWKATVRRGLDALPLDLPPDRPTPGASAEPRP
jgi:hypothetical protein